MSKWKIRVWREKCSGTLIRQPECRYLYPLLRKGMKGAAGGNQLPLDCLRVATVREHSIVQFRWTVTLLYVCPHVNSMSSACSTVRTTPAIPPNDCTKSMKSCCSFVTLPPFPLTSKATNIANVLPICSGVIVRECKPIRSDPPGFAIPKRSHLPSASRSAPTLFRQSRDLPREQASMIRLRRGVSRTNLFNRLVRLYVKTLKFLPDGHRYHFIVFIQFRKNMVFGYIFTVF